MQNIDWTGEAINAWTSKGIQLQTGAASTTITEFEKRLDCKFPQDFIDLYSKINGFGDFEWDENMFSLWSLERILKEYLEDGTPNYIGLCDFLINSHSIGFCKSNMFVYKEYNQTQPIAVSFHDFILLLNSNDDLLY